MAILPDTLAMAVAELLQTNQATSFIIYTMIYHYDRLGSGS